MLLDRSPTCHRVDFPYTGPEHGALLALAHTEAVGHGGRYESQPEAIHLWSPRQIPPAMPAESTRIGAFHFRWFRWGNCPGLWKIKTVPGWPLANLLEELESLEVRGLGRVKYGDVLAPRMVVRPCVQYLADPTARPDEEGRWCGETSLWMLLDHQNCNHALAAICALTQPGSISGTPLAALLAAAHQLGAARSYSISIRRGDQAHEFLTSHAPFMARVSPSKLYGRGQPEEEQWGHAVVVLKQEGGQVI